MSEDKQDPNETPDVLPLEQSAGRGLSVVDRNGSVVASTYGLDDEQGRRWAALIVREVNEAPKLRAEIERLRALLRSAGWYGPADYTTAAEWEQARYAALNADEVDDE